MRKKWKSLSALYLAAVLGMLMPLNTIKAAEGKDIKATAESNTAPVIEIRYQGQNLAQSMGGTIDYNLYIGNSDQRLSISVTQGGSLASLYYYIDKDASDKSKGEDELNSLWNSAGQTSYKEAVLGQDGKYVLYVKAEADNGQAAYVRTNGIVVDTRQPVINGIQEGGTYPLGTKFTVEDDNLDTVLVNEQEVSPSAEDGMYQVAANGTSCVVRAKDKAGHETTCSVTINAEGGNQGGQGSDKPQDDTNVISKSGTYSLRAGTAYRLDSGSWTLEGDSVTYRGGVTFYVVKDGDYSFKRN